MTCGRICRVGVVVSGARRWIPPMQAAVGASRQSANPELMAQGPSSTTAGYIWHCRWLSLRVCFGQHGRLKFLDSMTMPQRETDLAAEYIDGTTCGRIDRVGTVVLLAAGERARRCERHCAGLGGKGRRPMSTVCRLVTTVSLRTGRQRELRRALTSFGGTRLTSGRICDRDLGSIIPRAEIAMNDRLRATARSSDWYQGRL